MARPSKMFKKITSIKRDFILVGMHKKIEYNFFGIYL